MAGTERPRSPGEGGFGRFGRVEGTVNLLALSLVEFGILCAFAPIVVVVSATL